MKHIVSFSGGKDSTAMLLMMIEKSMQIDDIIFCDTTKEFPDMYKHIEKVKEFINPLKITTLSFDFDYWFGERIKTKGKFKNEVGYGFPNMMNRWCTALKRDTIKKYLKKYKSCIKYYGIAIDEKERCNKNNSKEIIKYPLVKWKITEKQALQYCYNKGFNWNELYNDFKRVSCYCCPLSNLKELKNLYLKYPVLWNKLKAMQQKSCRKFKNNKTVDEIEMRFKKEEKQLKLF